MLALEQIIEVEILPCIVQLLLLRLGRFRRLRRGSAYIIRPPSVSDVLVVELVPVIPPEADMIVRLVRTLSVLFVVGLALQRRVDGALSPQSIRQHGLIEHEQLQIACERAYRGAAEVASDLLGL